MPYDLYGTYYASSRDAENAELAQMAEINSRYAMKDMQRNSQVYSQYIESLYYDLGLANHRIELLEKKGRVKVISSNPKVYKRF